MTALLPDTELPTVSSVTGLVKQARIAKLDTLLVLIPPRCPTSVWKSLPEGERLKRQLTRRDPDSVPLVQHTLANRRNTVVLVTRIDATKTPFEQAGQLRKLAAAALNDRPGSLGVAVRGFDEASATSVAGLVIEALIVAASKLPTFRERSARERRLRHIRLDSIDVDAKAIGRRARANHVARWLAALPPNVLNAASYIDAATKLAESLGAASTFYGEDELTELGAGAFLAVAQGNATRDAGILHLSHRVSDAAARLALVGKGIIFDTGGNNLKPFKSMLNMHVDMQGSAVALAVFEALIRGGVRLNVDCWLAITENRIGATAYKSQDLIRTRSGKTIETIHTDAEGRMALADTLTLAAESEPDLIIDFATLTGACVTALTSRYSGVFTNRPELNPLLQRGGDLAAERVWPFPLTPEFLEDLKSDSADLIQCHEDGAGDHILAACFLNEFVPATVPWVHVDLSASTRRGGLGLVGTEITGFGTRVCLEWLTGTEANLLNALDD